MSALAKPAKGVQVYSPGAKKERSVPSRKLVSLVKGGNEVEGAGNVWVVLVSSGTRALRRDPLSHPHSTTPSMIRVAKKPPYPF